jgi:hypothetical protein
MSGVSVSRWAELLREVGPAHHQAFAATDGDDPDWPAWYAAWLHQRLPELTVSEEELADLLVEAAGAHTATGSTEEWQDFYAHFLSRLGVS